MKDEIERIRQIYATQYNPDPEDRNYIWHPLNPVSIYYRQAQERALTDLFRSNILSLTKLRVLDIGCGNGRLLRFLADLGIPPDQLHGIDLIHPRITAARQLAPRGMTLLVGNAETLPYPEQYFDLVIQFTVFSSILDAQLRQRVAAEMVRVLKAGGFILWYDIYKVRNATLHSLSMPEIHQLFPGLIVGHQRSMHPIRITQIISYSRFISKLWDNLPGLPKTHYLLLLQKP